jgi:hypothetical protein
MCLKSSQNGRAESRMRNMASKSVLHWAAIPALGSVSLATDASAVRGGGGAHSGGGHISAGHFGTGQGPGARVAAGH